LIVTRQKIVLELDLLVLQLGNGGNKNTNSGFGIHIVVGRDLECPNQQVNESYMLIQKAVETAN